MTFTRSGLGTCNPQHLADLISAALGMPITCDVKGDSIVIYEDVAGREEQVQAVIDSYVFDPDYGLPDRTWRDRLSTEIAFLSDHLISLTGSRASGQKQKDDVMNRLVRNQIRLLKFVRDNTRDSDA